MTTPGAMIRQAREAAGMGLRELARSAKKSAAFLSLLERGVYVEIAAGRGWHLVVEEISRIQHRVSSRRIREVPE